jgi:hypothetical protein
MKRRKFLVLGSVLSLSPYIDAKESNGFEKSAFGKEFRKVEKLIAAVQEHMFPEGSKLPSARSMDTSTFLFETITHKSYDKDIRAFILGGAEELDVRTKGRFLSMNTKEKEKALRAYENTGYGSNWLSRIMTVTMEGLFSDPVYGSNKKEAGWKALNAYGGMPRPKTRYVEL